MKFISIEGSELNLLVHTSFMFNASLNPFLPDVPPATVDRLGGTDGVCPATPQPYAGAWRHVNGQVNSVLPYSKHATANAVTFNSATGNIGHVVVDGSFLFGRVGAPYHPAPASQLSCVTKQQQDFYAQTIADQINYRVGKKYYWSGVKNCYIKNETTASNISAQWFHKFTLVKYLNYAPNDRLKPSDIGL